MADRIGIATAGLWQEWIDYNEDDSTRQKIVALVGQRLAGILTANGYKTDFGNDHVFLWRPTAFGSDELPAINYRDTSNGPDEGIIGAFRWRLRFELQVILAEGNTTPAAARNMIEDIYRAIGTDETWSANAQETDQPSDEMQFQQGENIVAGINIAFDVIYDADKWMI